MVSMNLPNNKFINIWSPKIFKLLGSIIVASALYIPSSQSTVPWIKGVGLFVSIFVVIFGFVISIMKSESKIKVKAETFNDNFRDAFDKFKTELQKKYNPKIDY